MTVDTSAVASVLFGEPDAKKYLAALASAERKFMSSFTYLETAMVVEARKGPAGSRSLAEFLAAAGVEQIAFDSSIAEVALDAWRRFGKGRHPAGLNIGDCASYALARVSNQPLLFKGEDFPLTDVPIYPVDDEPPG